tara:strand:- start:174 stop:500 length:327 start_codon:yes stop_codon:yes gene_type:complete
MSKEIVINGVTYIKKPVKRVFKSGEWVRVYSKAKSGSGGSAGPKAGDFGRVSYVGTSGNVTVDFGTLPNTQVPHYSSRNQLWNFTTRNGDKALTSTPSTSLLRHCKKS